MGHRYQHHPPCLMNQLRVAQVPPVFTRLATIYMARDKLFKRCMEVLGRKADRQMQRKGWLRVFWIGICAPPPVSWRIVPLARDHRSMFRPFCKIARYLVLEATLSYHRTSHRTVIPSFLFSHSQIPERLIQKRDEKLSRVAKASRGFVNFIF